MEVLSGIPQGSVLGPILFLLFVDDLLESVEGLVKIFADDTKVFTAFHEESDCERLRKDLDNLSDWSDRWQVSKCGVMHYGNQNEKLTYNMQEEGVKRDLVKTKEEEDLDVIFDPSMTFTKHIGMVANKANRIPKSLKEPLTTWMPRCSSPCTSQWYDHIWNMLTAYGIPFSTRISFRKESVQRRATKLVQNCKDLSYPKRLRYLKLPTLAYRRIREDMIQVYNIMHGLV